MAKVTLDAKAQIRNGILTIEHNRNEVLKVFGKNDGLLRETKTAAFALAKVEPVSLTRRALLTSESGSAIDVFLRLTVRPDLETVEVVAHDADSGFIRGTAVYGVTKFFAPAFAPANTEEE